MEMSLLRGLSKASRLSGAFALSLPLITVMYDFSNDNKVGALVI